jgi:GNAT superfamily N-acetyltransferase
MVFFFFVFSDMMKETRRDRMAEFHVIHSMEEFLEYNQLIQLVQDQMDYIGHPKTNEQIMETFRLAIAQDSAHLIVLSEHSHPVGFVYFNVAIGMESAGKYVWLNEMHIHKEYRNKGYGTRLFDALKNWCAKEGVVRIMGMADESETGTLRFYQHQGCETYPQQIFSLHLPTKQG